MKIELPKDQKLVMLTAYDFPTARVMEEASIDLLLVGDSLAMAVLGMKDTKTITLEEMLHHTRAVARACKKTPVIGDMPINTYPDPDTALSNARKFIKAGADAVKIEGCKPDIISKLRSSSIPVMAHLGLLPQTADEYKVQGREVEAAKQMVQDARAVEEAGAFSLVLECIPSSLGKAITEAVSIPTIGIGAGPDTSGQVLVIHDILGANPDFRPKFVKRYADIYALTKKAVEAFRDEVRSGAYPDKEHAFS